MLVFIVFVIVLYQNIASQFSYLDSNTCIISKLFLYLYTFNQQLTSRIYRNIYIDREVNC